MIPYKWPVATAIPQNPEVRREIAKALRTFVEDDDERLRQRRAEIASIRQGLAEIAHDVAKFRRDAPALILSELCKYGYNPEEPRVPKHNTGGGRWTRVAGNDDQNVGSDVPQFQENAEAGNAKSARKMLLPVHSGPSRDPLYTSSWLE